jgi:hypothetical protein
MIIKTVWISNPLRRGQTKETGNRNATAISEKNRLFEAGNWLPDQQAHTEVTYV